MKDQLAEPQAVESQQLLVSVIIPTYGRPEGLRRALEQLLRQDMPAGSYEIIVVDDGSLESLVPAVEAIASHTTIAVRCLRKENGGPASARNHGALAARAEYLLFVDDDIVVRPDFIRGHLETHQEFGPALVICEFEWRVDGKPGPFQNWHQRRVNSWTHQRAELSRPLGGDVYEIPSSLVASALLSMRREDFDRAGGIDTRYSYGACEDQDFAQQMLRLGVRTLMTRKTLATHIETHNSLAQLCQRQRRGASDTVRFVQRLASAYKNGRPAIETVNGPSRWGADPLPLIAKKAVKRVIASRLVSPTVFSAVAALERLIPESRLLPRVYELVIGAYIQKGWREGLSKHCSVAPI